MALRVIRGGISVRRERLAFGVPLQSWLLVLAWMAVVVPVLWVLTTWFDDLRALWSAIRG